MIEMLFSLMIFMAISAIALQLFLIIHHQTVSEASVNPKEWEIFCEQMQQEVRSSKSREAAAGHLYLVSGKELVLIEQYEDKLRKRVNGTGHEVLLQNIKHFRVENVGCLIAVTVTDRAGKEFSRNFHAVVGEGIAGNE